MTAAVAHEEALLELRGASRTFRTRAETIAAVADASLTLQTGEIVGLAGPSGSGKTTLLHLIMGWERPDAGTVELHEGLPSGWSGLAVVPQELGLLPELTARQNVELAGRLGGGLARSTAELFDHLGLAELADRLPDELSLGEQQRVAVARAVAAAPMLLVADEPTAHQDEQHGDAVMETLREVASSGGAVLVATHDERILGVVDRIVRMLDGHLST
ncbi:MAG: ATP-binding cassette domain-containing protein [Ilumatobacter sp.]|uniref:ATP-binding cassette domain-containing protein n=1 Tax=Ilumatobacter sp. TaxID=1967498 RepID=UPI0026254BD6|nr:ATP-binding cassette domain-containing protein [Ilumatobacter sp.]MDJ0770176.1 ATP-binding cassette domain-containing protein [Ilumatobacter sp.]